MVVAMSSLQRAAATVTAAVALVAATIAGLISSR